MSNLQTTNFEETKKEALEENMLKKLYALPQYSAEETGVPCVALDDVEKMLIAENDYILNASKCGLVFTGEYDSAGSPIFMGNNSQWKKFDDGSFD